MELKKYISEIQKIKSINTQFQNKLGEITIWINNINDISKFSEENINTFISTLQNFLCHNFYTEYMKIKTNENSTYDNCMNLILIILAKLTKINNNYSTFMFDAFINHLNDHLECFNYIISFYRLYITCPQLKQSGKNYGIFNYLFSIYRSMYDLNVNMEPSHKLKNLKSIVKSGIVNHLNNSIDKKFLFENYIMLTDRPGNYTHVKNKSNFAKGNNYNYGIVSSGNYNNISEDYQNEYSILHNKNNNSGTNNKQQYQISLIGTNNNNNNKANIISKTERKSSSNSKLSGDLNQNNNNLNYNTNLNNSNNNNNTNNNINSNNNNSILTLSNINNVINSGNSNINISEISLNSKDIPKGLKAKIPLLKFPLDKSQQHQRFSIIRSSHRAEFSKSGDGSSTTTTKNKLISNKLIENSSINRHFNQDILILEPKGKLKSLAFQLGESCLATDLAALINQKRDLELGKLRKKNNNNDLSSKNDNTNNYSLNLPSSQKSPKINNYIEKLKSINSITNEDISYDIESSKNNNNNTGALSKYDSKRSSNNYCNKSDNILIDNNKDRSLYSIQISHNQNFKNFVKIREILVNFILTSLREYSFDDISYLNIDTNTLFSFLLLPSLEHSRMKYEKKKN